MKMDEKASRGQTIRTETAPDRSSMKQDNKVALAGRKMGGGPRDVSHSLTADVKVSNYSDGK